MTTPGAPKFGYLVKSREAVPNPSPLSRNSLRLATCGYGQNTVDLWPIEAGMGGQAFDEASDQWNQLTFLLV